MTASPALKVEEIRSLQLSGDYESAARASLELCSMEPNNAEYLVSAALVHIGAEKPDDAVRLFLEGISLEPKNLAYKAFFLNTLLMAPPSGFNTQIRDFILSCLNTPDQYETDLLSLLWYGQMINDPDYSFLKNTETGFMDKIRPDQRSLLGNPYFTLGLSYLIVPDHQFEKALISLRRWLLFRALERNRQPDLWEIRLACAMARQCFLNEYIFDADTDEANALDRLKQSLNEGDEFLYAVCGCYEPLLPLLNKNRINIRKIVRKPGNAFQDLLRVQIDEPETEEKLRRKIPKLGAMENKVSQLVRQQYEENPYPRWTGMIPVTLQASTVPAIQALQKQKIDILIAGCGTGSHAAKLRMAFPLAKIKAIDLSLASLSYALRKANEAPYKNLDFIQCDILDVGLMKTSFDLIDSSGVLHHMERPEDGLARLTGVLKPGGFMKISLYSRIARTHVTELQDMIRNAGLKPDINGIRAARRMIFSLPPQHPAYSFIHDKIRDLYTASMLRDLLFHVQEHQFTIPEIRALLDSNNLEFIGFNGLSPAILKSYKDRYPQDASMTDLECWSMFESDHPDTFLRMYQFWCRKQA